MGLGKISFYLLYWGGINRFFWGGNTLKLQIKEENKMDRSCVKNVLLVENDNIDAELAMSALRKISFVDSLSRVSDGDEAIDYLHKTGNYKNRDTDDPVLILLDLNMQRMNGPDVIKAIHQDNKLKHIPIVVLTSSYQDKDVLKCYELGVNAYVVKPIDIDQFNAVINHIGCFWLMCNKIPKFFKV